ncbi:MAG: T9SS type A sorting domain-containing protein [Ignavibacteriae bacterium]|nr:T9SS type A sorting domain-containing protein [Ignavibacteriota bacterium]
MKIFIYLLVYFSFTTIGISQIPRLEWMNLGEEYKIDYVIYSPDGTKLYASVFKREGINSEPYLMGWDLNTKSKIKETQIQFPFDIADISMDGKFLVCTNYNNFMYLLYNLTDDEIIYSEPASANPLFPGIREISFSEDESEVYCIEWSYKFVQVFDAKTGLKKKDIECGGDKLRRYNFSKDGKLLATSELDSTLKIWDVGKDSVLISFKVDSVADKFKFSNDNKLVITAFSCANTEPIKIWDVTTGQLYAEFNPGGKWYSFGFSSDDKYLVAASIFDSSFSLIDLHEKRIVYTNEAKLNNRVFDISPNESRFAVMGQAGLELWDYREEFNNKYVDIIDSGKAQNHSKAFFAKATPDQKYVISCGERDQINVWDFNNGDKLKSYHTNSIRASSIDISADGKYLIISSGSELSLWNIEDGANMTFNKSIDANITIITAKISKDNKFVAAGGYGMTIIVWDIVKNIIHTIDSNQKTIYTVAFSPDSRTIISGTQDKNIHIYKLNESSNTFEKEFTFQADFSSSMYSMGVAYLSFTDDGKYILSGCSDLKAKIWDANNYSLIGTYEAESGLASNTIGSVLLSSDKKYVITIDKATSFRVFNYEFENEIWMNDRFFNPEASLSVHIELNSAEWSPDKKHIIVSLDNGTIALFKFDSVTSKTDFNIKNNLSFNIFPNPYEKDFTIDYEIEEPEKVSISLTNALGMIVDAIENETYKNPGKYKVYYDGTKLQPGMYYVTFKAGSRIETIKVVSIK